MSTISIEFKGVKEFQEALKRNPKVVIRSAKNYFVRGIAVLKQSIDSSAWQIGGGGGGVPVASGHMKSYSRLTEITNTYGKIYTDEKAVPYARYVHDGTRKMKARPWLDYAKKTKKSEIEKLQDKMLEEIVKDLSR